MTVTDEIRKQAEALADIEAERALADKKRQIRTRTGSLAIRQAVIDDMRKHQEQEQAKAEQAAPNRNAQLPAPVQVGERGAASNALSLITDLGQLASVQGGPQAINQGVPADLRVQTPDAGVGATTTFGLPPGGAGPRRAPGQGTVGPVGPVPRAGDPGTITSTTTSTRDIQFKNPALAIGSILLRQFAPDAADRLLSRSTITQTTQFDRQFQAEAIDGLARLRVDQAAGVSGAEDEATQAVNNLKKILPEQLVQKVETAAKFRAPIIKAAERRQKLDRATAIAGGLISEGISSPADRQKLLEAMADGSARDVFDAALSTTTDRQLATRLSRLKIGLEMDLLREEQAKKAFFQGLTTPGRLVGLAGPEATGFTRTQALDNMKSAIDNRGNIVDNKRELAASSQLASAMMGDWFMFRDGFFDKFERFNASLALEHMARLRGLADVEGDLPEQLGASISWLAQNGIDVGLSRNPNTEQSFVTFGLLDPDSQNAQTLGYLIKLADIHSDRILKTGVTIRGGAIALPEEPLPQDANGRPIPFVETGDLLAAIRSAPDTPADQSTAEKSLEGLPDAAPVPGIDVPFSKGKGILGNIPPASELLNARQPDLSPRPILPTDEGLVPGAFFNPDTAITDDFFKKDPNENLGQYLGKVAGKSMRLTIVSANVGAKTFVDNLSEVTGQAFSPILSGLEPGERPQASQAANAQSARRRRIDRILAERKRRREDLNARIDEILRQRREQTQ